MAITWIETLPYGDPSTGLLTLANDVAADDTIILIVFDGVSLPDNVVWNGGAPAGYGSWQRDSDLNISGGATGGFGGGTGITELSVWSVQPTTVVPAGTQIYLGDASLGSYTFTGTGAVFRGLVRTAFRVLTMTGTTAVTAHNPTPAFMVTVGPGHLAVTPPGDILIIAFGACENTDYWAWDDGSGGFSPVTPPTAPGVSLTPLGGVPSLTNLPSLTHNEPDTTQGSILGFPAPALRRAAGLVAYCITTDYTDKMISANFSGLIGGSGSGGIGFDALDQSAWGGGFIIYGAHPGLSDGPWNLQTRAGQYHVSFLQAGNVEYNRSQVSYPYAFDGPFELAGGGSDAQFRMAELSYPGSCVAGIWNRSGVILGALTDDDGETWSSSPVTLWGAGKNPMVAHDARSGTTIYACLVTDHLEGRVQGPGDSSPGTAFTLASGGGTPLPVDDATFHIQPAADTPGRWLLVLVDGGAVKNYWSGDDGRTWTVV